MKNRRRRRRQSCGESISSDRVLTPPKTEKRPSKKGPTTPKGRHLGCVFSSFRHGGIIIVMTIIDGHSSRDKMGFRPSIFVSFFATSPVRRSVGRGRIRGGNRHPSTVVVVLRKQPWWLSLCRCAFNSRRFVKMIT